MINKKIIIAGGSGFMGQEMADYFGSANEVVILTRQKSSAPNNRNRFVDSSKKAAAVRYVKWMTGLDDDDALWKKELEGADLLINLAGRTVNCRYTRANKQDILQSRVDAVKALGNAIRRCQTAPKLWINASSATIYRHATDRPNDEYNGEFHPGFSVSVCQQWEKSFFDESAPATRKVVLRMAITLGKAGVLIPYFNLLKFGLGGTQGPGNQMFSWIHIKDTCRMIEWLVENTAMRGVYDCCAPNPVTNRELMWTFRRLTNKHFGLPAPAFLLKMGARLIGTETELVLKSRWVLPTRASESGFQFQFPFIEEALRDIIARVPKSQYSIF